MNGMKNIFGKELARVFKDRKMIFSVFLLPVLLVVGIMYLMSNLISNMESDIESHKPIVYVQNETVSFNSFIKESGYEYDLRSISTDAERQQAEIDILEGNADLLIEFPAQMDDMVSDFQNGDPVPQVKTYYNPSEEYSNSAYQEISRETLEAYRQVLLSARVGNLENIAVFTVNSDNEEMIIQDEDKAKGKAVGMMLPYFITILLFAGAMGIGTDMIAGEKERGTMASMLVSPVKRSSIVLGKVFALMTISGISSLVYVVAMIVSMPIMSKAMTGSDGAGLNLNLSISQYLMIAALLVALAFMYSTVIALVSVFAKTTKEATSYVMPAYILVLAFGMMTMFKTGSSANDYYIPIYNSAIALKNILTQEITMMQFSITLGMTLAIGAILTGVIVKAFESEKVMSI